MRVGIIDYGSGNLHSAEKAFAYLCGAEKVRLVKNAKALAEVERIVLPGVGAFADCLQGVESAGLREALQEAVVEQKRPFLGICVGMQLMAEQGTEHTPTEGFAWCAGVVQKLAPNKTEKLPHIGWNKITLTNSHPVLAGLDNKHFYFVHSFAPPASAPDCLAQCDYGGGFCAVWGRENLLGVQFHPEKSQANGLQLLDNFLQWEPS